MKMIVSMQDMTMRLDSINRKVQEISVI